MAMTVPSRFATSKTEPGNPTIYTLKANEIKRGEKNKIRKLVISLDGNMDTTEYGSKVIMLVGETGSGKTLMMNALLNYVLGVKWEDSYRYKLDPDEDESKKRSHTQSQTEWISVYKLHHNKSYRIPYSITIVDTPGFGDTAGTSKDQKTTEHMKFFFSGENDEGIDHLHAVIFVAQSDKVRLTESQKYVFNCILSLFGKDVEDNIFLFTTFADQNEPLVLEAMKQADIPYNKTCYKFNNSHLYAKKESANTSAEGSSDEEREAFNEMFWKSGARELKKFFKVLRLTSSKSTWLSSEVLKEREALNNLLLAIPQLIRSTLVTLKYLSIVQEMFRHSQDEVTRHSEYTYTVNVEITEEKKLPDGEFAMTCRKCKVNCHYPCGTYVKFLCPAFYWFNGCSVCPNNCAIRDHGCTNIFYEKKVISVQQTYAEVKTKYLSARKESLSHKELVEKVSADAKKKRDDLSKHVSVIRKTLNRLDVIALKKNPTSTAGYLKKLIEAEKAGGELGWEDRVVQLEELLREAKLQDLAEGLKLH